MNQLSMLDQIHFDDSSQSLHSMLIEFCEFGNNTICKEIDGIPYYINEFWTAGQRQAHSLHEVSYRACFKAQLPEFFISRLTRKNDIVYDPFMGRGTTPIQAGLMGRQAYGNDINPLSILLCRPRLRPVSILKISNALHSVDWTLGAIEREDLLAFYHPKTLQRLESLRLWLARNAPLDYQDVDPTIDWIRMVALNRLSGHSPGFFSGRSMPPNQAVSIKSQLKINEKLGASPPVRDVTSIILKKSRTLLKDGSAPSDTIFNLFTGPAWQTPKIKSNSVSLVVTSPPFLDIVQYAADNWLRCWFAGFDVNTISIDMHRTETAWIEMVRKVLIEQARILRIGGHVAFEVGEVRNGQILLERLVWKAAEGLPFERLGVMINQQEFTKTANCWGVNNGSKGTNTNRVVILKRT
jgi:hypothetical protein